MKIDSKIDQECAGVCVYRRYLDMRMQRIRENRAFYSPIGWHGNGRKTQNSIKRGKGEKKRNDRLKKLVFPVTQTADDRPEIKVAATFTSKCGEEECVVRSAAPVAQDRLAFIIGRRSKVQSQIRTDSPNAMALSRRIRLSRPDRFYICTSAVFYRVTFPPIIQEISATI